VSIHVEANNPAMTLYRRLGFTHVDTNGVYHLMRWEREGTEETEGTVTEGAEGTEFTRRNGENGG
jgi:hypothetical protein